MTDSVDECTDPRKRSGCTPHTFEQGKNLVERDGIKPDKDGWIKIPVGPWMTLARRLNDPDDNCRVVETTNGDITKSWDYCMGILAGMGYGSVWTDIIFLDDDNPRFETEINVGKTDCLKFKLAEKDKRWYALESHKSYSEQATVLTRMWKVLEKDIPPRFRDNIIRTLTGFSSLEGDPNGVFTMKDFDHNVLRFEIHRGALLRLDDNDKAIGAGLGALYVPSPRDMVLLKKQGGKMNLLKETKEALRNKGYSWPDDILSIQGSDRAISVGLFKKLANVNYENGYGGQEVAKDLVVLMRDGTWFERDEYDGSEWWRHRSAPKINPVNDEGITTLVATRSNMIWSTLEELNKEPEDDE